MAKVKDCPICSLEPLDFSEIGKKDMYRFACKRCGSFLVTKEVLAFDEYRYKLEDPRLSAWVREQKEYNREAPEIWTTTLEDILNNLPQYTPTEKQLILLRAIERRTKYPGAKAGLVSFFDYPIAWATNADELNYYVEALAEREFIYEDRTLGSTKFEAVIRPKGWDYLEKYSLEPAFVDQAFVAMSFSKQLDPAYEKGIKVAVREAGYKPYHVGKQRHMERIDAKIITEIRNSRFLIADVTEQKQGVYFEAGFAIGLKRPVIWSVRKDELEKVHFDTRQYNHITWEKPKDLEEELYYFICATVGKNK